MSVVKTPGRQKAPPVPIGIGPAGRAAWNSFWRSDVAYAVDLDADMTELHHWVRCIDERDRFWDLVKKAPLVKGSNGQLMTNPLSRRIRDLSKDIDRISDRFGMNPMSRFRLQLTYTEAGKSALDLDAMQVEGILSNPKALDLHTELLALAAGAEESESTG